MARRASLRGVGQRRARRDVQPGHVESWGRFDVPGIGPRSVRVYVPSGEAQRSVVVLFDGQNVFGNEGSFAGGWFAHRAADRVVTMRRPAPLVVALDHGYGARQHELSPLGGHGSRGELDHLLSFVGGRLRRAIAERFAVPAEPRRWIVGGASLGGLAALYAHFAIPEVFGGAICLSPSLWLGGRRFGGWLASRPLPWSSRLYLDCGVREGRGTALPTLAATVHLLRRRGYGEDRLRFRRNPRGRHDEASWRQRLPGALRFVLD